MEIHDDTPEGKEARTCLASPAARHHSAAVTGVVCTATEIVLLLGATRWCMQLVFTLGWSQHRTHALDAHLRDVHVAMGHVLHLLRR